jgi:hypothetical protein
LTLPNVLLATATLLAAAPKPTGSWTSPSCFARDYKRDLVLEDDGTFTADDVPSPCPGECVVQHVLRRQGKWKLTNGIVRFTVTKTDDTSGQEAKRAAPLPAELRFDTRKHALIEDGAKGACVYQGE